jgi:hypothetical protein
MMAEAATAAIKNLDNLTFANIVLPPFVACKTPRLPLDEDDFHSLTLDEDAFHSLKVDFKSVGS